MGQIENKVIEAEILKGKSDREAYQEAFHCSEANARGNASNYIKANPNIKFNCIQILEKRADLTIDKALDAIQRGLTASNEGKFGTHSEYATQLESAKLLLRLYGELSDKPTQSINVDARSINICLTPEYIDRVYEVLDRFKEMRSKPSVIDGEIVRSKPKEKDDTAIDV
jgi:hypothetical protein